MLHRVPCTDKVRNTIGWTPEQTLDDILLDVIKSAAWQSDGTQVAA
jgi:hypothetical protein